MNRILSPILLAITMLVASCAGPHSKAITLFPAADTAWPAVEEDFNRGVEDGVSDGDISPVEAAELRSHAAKLEVALDARDVYGVRDVPWTSMQPWASRGIDDQLEDGEIGPGVASSLREQLVNFTTTIADIQGAF